MHNITILVIFMNIKALNSSAGQFNQQQDDSDSVDNDDHQTEAEDVSVLCVLNKIIHKICLSFTFTYKSSHHYKLYSYYNYFIFPPLGFR